jgi:hypothetical protein
VEYIYAPKEVEEEKRYLEFNVGDRVKVVFKHAYFGKSGTVLWTYTSIADYKCSQVEFDGGENGFLANYNLELEFSLDSPDWRL